MNTLLTRFRRDIIGLVWLSTGIFVALALASYKPTDPSFNSIGKSLTAQNYCGYFGSFLADLLYQFMGLASWVVVLGCLRMAYLSFLGKDVSLKKLRFIWAALLLLTSSSLISLYWPDLKIYSDQVHVGGFLGMIISTSLISVFNFAGVAVILWTLAAMLLVFYTERPLLDLFHAPLELAQQFFSFLIEHAGLVLTPFRWMKEQMVTLFSTKVEMAVSAGGAGSAGRFALEQGQSESKRRFFNISKHDDEEEEFEEEEEYEEGDEEEWEAEASDDEEEDDGFQFTEEELKGPQLTLKKSKKKPARRKVRLKKKIQRHIANWELPKISLLEDPPATRFKLDEKEIKSKAHLLTDKLAQFSVRGSVEGIKPGPAVTMFEFKPAADVKISKITELADDLSLALSSESVRIIAPIPGRDVVGIETSNSNREGVFLKDILVDDNFWDEDYKLPLALGRQADGEAKVVDLRKMPHLMVAGTTGSGKSVFVVSILTGLLFKHSPKTLNLILVDPKQVDLAAFNDIPHLVMPPIREPKKAVGALRWAIKEMEKRYRSMSKFGARGIEAYNKIVSKLSKEEIEQHEQINEELEGAAKLQSYYYTELPYIVIVVEEFGDLMSVDKANVEQAVVRLAQMARACGIHLILAMQSPRKDVVTGLIKTNIPGRISFKVASKMDSRIILDEGGAERLLARGDMLFLAPGVSKPERHHGPYLPEEEISDVVNHWRKQGEPCYDPIALRAIEGSGGGFDLGGEDGMGDEDEIKDEKYDEVLAYVSTLKEVSASLLQRRFRLGYPRAARMIEIFESEGVVGPANGSKPRQVLVSELK